MLITCRRIDHNKLCITLIIISSLIFTSCTSTQINFALATFDLKQKGHYVAKSIWTDAN